MQYRLELEDPQYRDFMMNSATEIGFMLRAMAEQKSMVMVYFNNNKSFFMTTLLGVEPESGHLLLEYSNSTDTNREVLKATELACASTLDKVKVQFATGGVTQVMYKGRPAFQARMPGKILRLQRRENYRVPIPAVRPIKCLMLVKDDFGNLRQIDVPLLDISAGGVGLMLASNQGRLLSKDEVYTGCRMELPDEGVFTCSLRVCDFIPVSGRGGGGYIRAGCEFVDLRGSVENMIQRYIIRLERERKARASALS